MKNDHKRAPRGVVAGWSEGATRRNIAFLRSVNERRLSGRGYAFTLTLRHCPDSPDDWHRLRKAFAKRVERYGMLRLHWVTEWQRRGVPHLHGAIWFPDELVGKLNDSLILNHLFTSWFFAGGLDYGANYKGQHGSPIGDAVGWFQYLSKHAARGVKHYQRSPENIPEGWKSKTGRVWGHWGEWPLIDFARIVLQTRQGDGDGGWFAFRRLVRAWRTADARMDLESTNDDKRSAAPRRLRYARTMLKSPDRKRSEVRGISEWIPFETHTAFLGNLGARGFSVAVPEEEEIKVTNE
jgi:hypothetical protein